MQNTLMAMTDRFSSLPDDAQKAIRLFKYDDALRALHLKHKLHIDQAAALESDVADVIFGDRKPSELIPALSKDLHIEAAAAKIIAFDINDTVLRPIQDLMKLQVEENDASVFA